jgi:hypothetical protein
MRKHLLLTKQTLTAKMERRKRAGTYRTGMNLDDSEEECEEDCNPRPEKKKRKTKAPTEPVYCEFCGKKGHVTKRAKACTASAEGGKLYQKIDGTLLSGPANPVIPQINAQEQQEDPADPMIVGMDALHVLAGGLHDATDDFNDCDRDDRAPLVEGPDDDSESESDDEDDGAEGQLFFDVDADLLESDESSDSGDSTTSSVQRVGIMRANL